MAQKESDGRELVLEANLGKEELVEFLTSGELTAKWDLMDDMSIIMSIKSDIKVSKEDLEALIGKDTTDTQGLEIDWWA